MDFNFNYLLCLFLLLSSSTLIVCSSSAGSFLSTEQLNKPSLVQTAQHDTTETPPITTTLPTNPVTTPATATPTAPPDFSMSPIVTIPSVNPAAPITLPPPTQNPTVTPPIPITNPVTTPSTTIPGSPQPVTNPVTTYPYPTSSTPVVVVSPPGTTTTNAPAVPGQNWCVAKSGVKEMTIQAGLDYACGLGVIDCSAIQVGASCYSPNSLQNHASYAFNSYYQRNPVPTSCDFGGTATITNVNPSSGSCVFKTRSSSSTPPPTTSSPPVTTTPITMPTPTTESSSGATPSGSVTPQTVFNQTVFNASSPALGGGIIPGYGGDQSPPTANISSASSSFQPFLGCIIMVTTIITAGCTVLDV